MVNIKNSSASNIPIDEVTASLIAGNSFIVPADAAALLPAAANDEEKDQLLEWITRELGHHEELLTVIPGEKYAVTAKVFAQAQFLIVPDAFEIENNILIPGHRFVPFMSLELFPSDITLKEAGARKAQSFREFNGRAEEIIKFHLLMGAETLFDFFAAEHEDNIDAARESADPMLKLSVLDMKKFYAEADFREGDALLVKVIDFESGIFEFRLDEQGKYRLNSQEAKKFRSSLESALTDVTENLRTGAPIIEQIQCALVQEPALLNKPVMSLDEILVSDPIFDIAFDEDGSSLVRRDEEGSCSCGHHDCGCGHDHAHEQYELPDNVTIGSGEIGSLESMLSKLYPMLNLVELDAILLDNLRNRDLDFNSFYSRAFGETALAFADGMQEAAFFNELEMRFEEMQDLYPRDLDDQCAPLRSQIVEFTMERCGLLAEFAEQADTLKLEPQLFEDLAEVVLLLDEALKLLNAPGSVGEDFNFEEFSIGVDQALESGEEALTVLRGVLEGND